MKLATTFAILLATALTATAASADWKPREETQAPRSQDLQAPRTDEMQAPRGAHPDAIQTPHGHGESPRR